MLKESSNDLLLINKILKFIYNELHKKYINIEVIYCENEFCGIFFINNNDVFTENFFSSNKFFIDNLYNNKLKSLKKMRQKDINFYHYSNVEKLINKYDFYYNYNSEIKERENKMNLLEKSKKLNIDVTKDVKYFYFRPKSGEFEGIDGGSITIAYCKQMGFVGVAFQSPKDQFVKKIGRNIALGRMIDKAINNGNPDIKINANGLRTENIKDYVMNLISTDEVPNFLRYKK